MEFDRLIAMVSFHYLLALYYSVHTIQFLFMFFAATGVRGLWGSQRIIIMTGSSNKSCYILIRGRYSLNYGLSMCVCNCDPLLPCRKYSKVLSTMRCHRILTPLAAHRDQTALPFSSIFFNGEQITWKFDLWGWYSIVNGSMSNYDSTRLTLNSE